MMKRVLLIAAAFVFAAPAFAQVPADPAATGTPSGEVWELDQLRVPRDTPEDKLKKLEPDHSMDAAIKTLTGLGIAFKRVHIRIFPDKLPPELKTALSALPQGEPFILPDETFWSISVIVGRTLPPGSVRFAPTSRFAAPQKA